METNIKEQLINSVDNIKNKIKTIQNEEDASNFKFQKVFKPITDPLEMLIKVNGKVSPSLSVSKNMNKHDTFIDLNSSIDYENFRDLIKSDSSKHSEYYDFIDDAPKSEQENDDTLLSLKKEDVLDIYDNINVPFGIRSENKKLMMGNAVVQLSLSTKAKEKQYIVTVNNNKYELTAGLRELLMRNKPDLKLVTEKDKVVYKAMLINTNAHKRDFNPSGQIKGDKGLKYREIIKPLFSQLNNDNQNFPEKLTKLKTGGYLPELKKYKSNTDYVYWDDPNELIERLKLLIASRNAGNDNHDNEIVSIIEELREAGIIKENNLSSHCHYAY